MGVWGTGILKNDSNTMNVIKVSYDENQHRIIMQSLNEIKSKK